MSEKEKKLWNEIIDNIDEKYIDKTAEALAKNNASEGRLTEIIVEKPQDNKNTKLRHAAAIALTAAASIGLIFGAGHILKKYNIREENPSQTTTNITVATPDTIQTTAPPVTEGEDTEISISKFSDYSVQLSISDDGSPLVLEIFVDGVNTCQLITDIPPVKIGASKPQLKTARLKDGDIAEIIVPKLGENNTGIEYTIYLFHTDRESISPLLNESGERFSFVSAYDYCIEDIEKNSVQPEPAYGKERLTYMIDFESCTVTETFLYPVDNNLNYVNIGELEFTELYDIEDNPFMGRWIRAYGGNDNIHYPLTISANKLIAETEDGIFLRDVWSDLTYYFFMCPDYPDYMFRYYRLDDNTITFSNYEVVFKRAEDNEPYINTLTADYDDFDVQLTYETYTDIKCVRFDTVYMNDIVFTKELGMTFEIVNDQPPILAYEEYESGNLLALTIPLTSETVAGKYKTYLYSCTKDSIEEIKILDASGNPAELISTEPLHFYNTAEPLIATTSEGCVRARYTIDIHTLTAKESKLFYIDGNSEEIRLNDLNLNDSTENYSLFDEYFYGKWKVVFSESINYPEGDILNLTYNGDFSGYSWNSLGTAPYETEDSYMMVGVKAGEPHIITIYKDDPEHIYYYEYPYYESFKSDYTCVYERLDTDPLKEIRTGEITAFGSRYIYESTGFSINETPNIVTDDEGVEWKRWAHKGYLGTGQIYLRTLSEETIRYSLLYGSTDPEAYDYITTFPDVRYLNFTAEKTDGKWNITKIEAYDRELEENTDELTELKQRVIEAKDAFGMDSSYVLKGVCQEIIYYPRSDGTYYAYRRVSDDEGRTCHSEFYYYSGVSWIYLGGCEGESFPMARDDLFYYAIDYEFAPDYTKPDEKEWRTILYVWDKNTIKNACYPEYVRGINYVSVEKAGDYNIVYIRNQLDKDQIFIHTNTILSSSLEEADAIALDPDGEGFSVQIDFTEYIYRPNCEGLYENLWHLLNSAETVWEATMNGSHHITQGVDYTKTIISSDGTELGYFCEAYELYDYLSSIYTDECINEIFEESRVDLTIAGGSVYANGKFSREPYIGDIEWKILYENESEAEILCVLYPYDHKNQKQSETPCNAYLVSALRDYSTGYKWKLNDFKLKDVAYDTEATVTDRQVLRAMIFLTELEPSVMKAVGSIVLDHIADEDFWNNDNTYLHPTKEAVEKFSEEALKNPALLDDKDLVYYECQNGYWNDFDFE